MNTNKGSPPPCTGAKPEPTLRATAPSYSLCAVSPACFSVIPINARNAKLPIANVRRHTGLYFSSHTPECNRRGGAGAEPGRGPSAAPFNAHNIAEHGDRRPSLVRCPDGVRVALDGTDGPGTLPTTEGLRPKYGDILGTFWSREGRIRDLFMPLPLSSLPIPRRGCWWQDPGAWAPLGGALARL